MSRGTPLIRTSCSSTRRGFAKAVEPLRTLDALHVASVLAARSAIPNIALLSLDGRVRENGVALGFDVLPE